MAASVLPTSLAAPRMLVRTPCRVLRQRGRIEYCSEHDLDGWRPFLIAVRAEVGARSGALGRRRRVREPLVLADRGLGPATVIALVTLGRLRARRGDPGQWAPLDDALELAEPIGRASVGLRRSRRREPRLPGSRVAPRAWQRRPEAAFELAQQQRIGWLIGELAYWRWRAGIEEETPPGAAEPYALQIAGDWRRAADLWARARLSL